MNAANYFGNVGTAATNSGLGLATGGIMSAINYHYAKKMAKLNYKYNEKAAANADQRRRDLYADFESPMATIRQLKEAGLSPSLYAAGELGGTIGSTAGAQGAGASGVGMPNMSVASPDMSEIKVQEAQARLMNAEADKLEGKNEEGKANIEKLTAEAQAAYAKAGLDKESQNLVTNENALKQIEIDVQSAAKEHNIKYLQYKATAQENEATWIYWQGEKAQLDWTFDVNTFDKRKEQIANTCVELAAKAAMEHSQKELNNEQKENIKNFVNIQFEEAKAHTQNAKTYGEYVEALKDNMKQQIELRGKELTAKYWEMGVNAVTSIVQGSLFSIGAKFFSGGSKKPKRTTKEYYAPSGASKGYTITNQE